MIKRNSFYLLTGLLSVLIISIAMLVLFTKQTVAQEEYTGPKWEYLELSLPEPSNFATVIAQSYFINGEQQTHPDPNLNLGRLINFYGSRGWELVSNLNNQFFLFKRQVQ